MGHRINALIGQRPALTDLIERFGPPGPIDLALDQVLVPLDEQRLDAIVATVAPPLDGFTYLTAPMAREIGGTLRGGRALYFETDFFSGAGKQGAALFEEGAMIWHRSQVTARAGGRISFVTRLRMFRAGARATPISEGLARLGIIPEGDQDGFDRLDLGRFRSLEALGLKG